MSMLTRSTLYALATIVVWVYIAVRAHTVPISHDEAVTFLLYVQSGKFLPWNMVWDANNHLLNSMLMWPCWKLFGMDLLSLRLPNVLSFGLYAWFGFKLIQDLRKPLIWALVAAAWLSPALLVMFFAQMRGYGLSIALLSAALWYFVQFMRNPNPKALWSTWPWLVAALLANMSMMNTYLIALFVSGIGIALRKYSDRATWAAWFVGGVFPFAALTFYALAMRSGGLLYYGERDGFVEVTVRTLMRYTVYTDSMFVNWAAALFGAVAGLWLASSFLKKSAFAFRTTGVIASIFLLLNVLGAVALCYLLEVNYPEDRTGIYFLPLFILTIGYFADALAVRRQHYQWLAMPLIAFPVGFISHGNLGYTHLWQELHQDEGHYRAMLQDAGARAPEATIEGYTLMASSWGYHTLKSDTLLQPLIPAVLGAGRADYLLCFADSCERHRSTHDTLYSDLHNDMHLLKRKKQIIFHRIPFEWSKPDPMEGSQQYFNLYVSEEGHPIQQLEAIELYFTMRTGTPMPLSELVISARNEADETVYYDAIGLSWLKPSYDGDTLHIRRLLRLPENATKMVCYIWNMTERPLQTEVIDVGLLRAGK